MDILLEKQNYNDTSSSEFDQDLISSTYERAKPYGKSHNKKMYTPSILSSKYFLKSSNL